MMPFWRTRFTGGALALTREAGRARLPGLSPGWLGGGLEVHQRLQPSRILDGMRMRGVVEDAPDGTSHPVLFEQRRRQRREAGVVVGAVVHARRAVQAKVAPPSCVPWRVLVDRDGRVRRDTRDVEPFPQCIGLRFEPAGVARFAGDRHLEGGPQVAEAGARHARIEGKGWRQLYEHAAEFRAQPGDVAREVADRGRAAHEARFMRDRLRQLDRESECPGHGGGPPDERLRPMPSMERRIHLHDGKPRGVARQPGVSFAEQARLSRRDGPARASDPDHLRVAVFFDADLFDPVFFDARFVDAVFLRGAPFATRRSLFSPMTSSRLVTRAMRKAIDLPIHVSGPSQYSTVRTFTSISATFGSLRPLGK